MQKHLPLHLARPPQSDHLIITHFYLLIDNHALYPLINHFKKKIYPASLILVQQNLGPAKNIPTKPITGCNHRPDPDAIHRLVRVPHQMEKWQQIIFRFADPIDHFFFESHKMLVPLGLAHHFLDFFLPFQGFYRKSQRFWIIFLIQPALGRICPKNYQNFVYQNFVIFCGKNFV